MLVKFPFRVLPVAGSCQSPRFPSQWKPSRLLVLILILFLNASPCLAADFSGRVTEVLTGDTLVVVHNGQLQRVRLFGVDAPDKRQPFGLEAKQFTTRLVLGKQVTVEFHGKDQDKQILAEIFLDDGRALGERLIGEGLAWWYRTHTKDAGVGQQKHESAAAALGLAMPGARRAADQETVTRGFAWWHWKQIRDQRLKDLEAQARAEGRGLWKTENLLPL